MKKTIAILLILNATLTLAQESPIAINKTTSARRIDSPPKIDGLLHESIWNTPPTFTGLTEYLPTFGNPEEEDIITKVWIFYDDTGLYIGAEMMDKSQNIKREFTKRDDTGNADWFSVLIDTYRDGLNGYEFGVTTAGVQFDKRYSPTTSRGGGGGAGGGAGGGSSGSWGGGDQTWDAVWHSAVHVEADRWTVEMKIPYSAIRFSDKPEQRFGFNVQRYRRETRQELFWSPRRPEIDNFISQWGVLEGITDVKAPLILSLSPYVAVAADHYTQTGWQNGFTAGADIKWGISQAFTLDAALIPDFGQVQSDPRVHNLTPFEVQYNEKRPFFMEGSELFSKGSYFYSRRIGGQPMYYNAIPLESNEVVTDNPSESRLINTLKFSGRTSKGLGIGVLNSITSSMYATIRDTLTGTTRRFETTPFVNSNVLVFDQTLRNNSYLSAVNTSVLRMSGDAYNSNVTGLLFRFNDQNRRYYLQGQGTATLFSHKDAGFSYTVRAGKARGLWQYYIENAFLDDNIDINDLGLQRESNLMNVTGYLSFNNYTPSSWYSRYSISISPFYTQRYIPWSYAQSAIETTGMLLLKDYTMFRITGVYSLPSKDFYEPKKEGRYYNNPDGLGGSFYVSTNYNKPVFLDMTLSYEKYLQNGYHAYNIQLKPGFRISQKVTLFLTSGINNLFNDYGYHWRNAAPAGSAQDTIIFACRNRSVIENVVDGRFTFNNKMNITLSARHYVSKVQNKEFFFLNQNGDLNPTNFKGADGEVYNLFFIDFLYTWRFAPGSELNFIWKNEINPQGVETLRESYIKDIRSLSNASQRNILSIKLIYYIDWMTVMGRK